MQVAPPRDEFRFFWKKMSGDVSLAADIVYPDPNGFGDRKAVLVIRQDLEDDSKEVLVAVHGAGMIHLAQRPEKNVPVKDMEYRIGGRGLPGGKSPDSLVGVIASASLSKSTAIPSRSSSAWMANRCTSSAHPSTCISMGRSTPGSAFARTCRTPSIPRCSPTSSSRTPREGYTSSHETP